MHELRLLRTRRSGRDPPEAWRAGDHSVLKSRRPALSRNQEKAAPARQKTAGRRGLALDYREETGAWRFHEPGQTAVIGL
jgi:hypothetical protein